MNLKEMIVDMSTRLSALSADNMMKVALHFAKTSEAHWHEVTQGCELNSPEYLEAADNWHRVRILQSKIKEAQGARGYFMRKQHAA